MQQLSTIPKLEIETIEIFVRENGFTSGDGIEVTRRTRTSLKKVVDNVIVEDLKIETVTKTISIQGVLKEVPAVSSGKAKKKKIEVAKAILSVHTIKAELHEVIGELKSVQCKDCDNVKAKCTKIYSYLLWLQQKQQQILQEIENAEESIPKKIKRERNGTGILQPVNLGALPVKVEMPSLPKLKKEAVASVCPLEMESAMRLSLFNLIREYQGSDPQEFLEFCGNRMLQENCGKAQLLTIEQADTDLCTGGKGWLTCRQVLNIMVIFGFMLNYALRVNFTIAIVVMAKTLKNIATGGTDDGVLGNETSTASALALGVSSTTEMSAVHEEDKFEWDAYQQNLMLGSFFWGYVLTELPGGRLAEIVGGRRVFGYSMLCASVLTLLTPLAAYTNYIAVVILRAVLGFFLGASWPAIHPLTAVWIPPMDRSKFIANMMASSLGAAITMPICGYLIATIGWQSVFYFTGGLALLWSIIWFMVVFETPASHPRISAEELNEIETAISAVSKAKKPTYVPWKSILTSPPVWAIILTHGASVFGFFTVVNQLPTYMKYILHFNIKENGLLSSLPYFGKYAMAVISSHLADHLRKNGTLSTTATRKIFTAFAVMTPGFLMIVQVYMGDRASWAVGIFTLSLFLNGAVTAGYLGNGLDIAPNFSGTIFGMANTLSSFGGFVSAYIVGVLTNDNQTYGQWQIVFWILAVVYIVGSSAYLIMGTGELQPWNNPPEKGDNCETEEGVPLNQQVQNNKPISSS